MLRSLMKQNKFYTISIGQKKNLINNYSIRSRNNHKSTTIRKMLSILNAPMKSVAVIDFTKNMNPKLKKCLLADFNNLVIPSAPAACDAPMKPVVFIDFTKNVTSKVKKSLLADFDDTE